MRPRMSWRLTGRSWLKLALVLSVFTGTGLAWLWARGDSRPRGEAEAAGSGDPRRAQAPQALGAGLPTPLAAQAPAPTPEYGQRVVGYLYGTMPISREQLGEYLVARLGHEKLKPLVNRLIIEHACRQKGIEVTAAEVEADLADSLKNVPGSKKEFLDQLLRQKHLTLYEWKEDVIRPKLLLSKLCRGRVTVTDEDVRMAYEAYYGDRVLCQIIVFTPDEFAAGKPAGVHAKVRDSKDAFDEAAKNQHDSKLAAAGGMLNAMTQYSTGNREMEIEAFKLQEGEVSPVLRVPAEEGKNNGAYILKCVKRIPATGAKKLADVRPELEKEVLDFKVREDIKRIMPELEAQAKPHFLADYKHGGTGLFIDPSRSVLATIYGNTPVTREELGEYLIARYGAQYLDLLVNKLVVERVCKEKGITVSDAEIDAALAEDCEMLKVDKAGFIDKFLKPYGKTLYEWREDALRPKLLMGKLCQGDVKATDDDVQKAFEAYYGEKVECQMIMWPRGEEHIARKLYARLRDADEFDRFAKQQPSSELSSKCGKLDPFGRHTLGNDEVEKVAFKLKPGELSPVMTVPDGVLVLKCLRHIPPNDSVKLADVRSRLEKEVFTKKLQARIPAAVEELRKQAQPTLLLAKPLLTEDDLKREVEQELQNAGPAMPRPKLAPAGN